MTRKIIKIGSSKGITIPEETMRKLNLKQGERVEVTFNKENRVIEVKPIKKESKDKELLNWTKEFVKEYKDALEKLAKN